ncbi:hypothetical protein M5X00_24085 [Paenibacillus alvei]|uniref:Uncharacterized protein n=1 Tax=Paenibacillus alvei TaxID=44250 RepID=A0ABT4GR52_PAEAL|nr:hypothetical protein [Paenibacillus alvei]MCY9543599.1 hypothetical protein [Paenibacillus alvei]MCY9737331.1 hypothetical protein [Paenibacillus alvei]MCY9757309.1 hypothetical protein [Paenibacillus alvei]MCY9759160.1 hypothetical protein [Paenibacillus alvei]MCY9770381.1 hypothetical protein [Paenibacillus alvei]
MHTPTVHMLSLLLERDYHEDVLIDHIMRWSKQERKDKTKREIKERQLAIYKKDHACEVVDDALNTELVMVIEFTERGRKLRITNEGKLSLVLVLTHNFSDEYKAYADKISQAFEAADQLSFPKTTVMKFFYYGRDPEEVVNSYCLRNKERNHILDFHNHLLHDVAKVQPLETDQYIFHLAPTLFVPSELMGKKASLEIIGLEEELPKIVVTSPYPNKRYYIAGMKEGRSNTAAGFYIVRKKDEFPLYQEITLRWLLDNNIRIDHRLEISFQFASSQGRLFSTSQQLMREIANVDTFRVTTSISEDSYYERDAKLIVHDIFNHFEIQERVVLTNIPMEMHYMTTAGGYFSRWYKHWLDCVKTQAK